MLSFEAQAKELIDYLRDERPAFAADIDNGETLMSAHDGHFVAWDEIISACGGGCYGESPLELIAEIINQREALRDEMKAIALVLGRSKTDGESDCDWHAMSDDVEDLVSRNENLEIEHDVMFCRLRDANGQYTPDEVSKLIDAEIKARSAESV